MKLLDHNPFTGVTEYYKTEAGKSVIMSVQDAEPFVRRSLELSRNLDKKEDWWYVGTIPDVIIMKWANEAKCKPYSKKWQAYAMKQMNLPDYRKFNPNRIKLDTRDR